jgi:aspartate/methionine/tyrosine aminotransferase
MKRLSKASQNLLGQPMFKLLARVQELERQGKDIIHFEIGDPDFLTPSNIVEKTCQALRKGETHYTSSRGLYDFRVAVCDTTEISRGFRPDMGQVLITPGANIIIYYAVRCVVDPGDDVIVPNPYFPSYRSVIEFCQANPIYVPLREENEFRMDPDDIRAKITDRTRLIIINSPHNPCGSVMTREELDAVFDIAEKYDVYLLSDEVYSRMIYDASDGFYSPACRDRCEERTLLTNGFSKAFAMTGWRLGCVIGPECVIEKMELLLQTTSSCVTPFIQRAGIEAIKGPHDEVNKMMAEYRARRDLIVEGLNALAGVRCLKPGGAFYVFPNITGTGMDEITFANVMLEEAGVALLPGSNFGDAGSGYVRLCYATDRSNITKGIERMNRCLRKRIG